MGHLSMVMGIYDLFVKQYSVNMVPSSQSMNGMQSSDSMIRVTAKGGYKGKDIL